MNAKALGMLSSLTVACAALLAMIPQAEAPLGFVGDSKPDADLIERLPASTVLVIELRDFRSRWHEIRALPAIARFQDRLLGSAGIEASELPRILGNRTIVALVPDPRGSSLIPVVLVRPHDPDRLIRLLETFQSNTGVTFSAERDGAVVAISPLSSAGRFEPAAPGRLAAALGIDEASERLPAGGLVRGWINPQGASRWLTAPAEGTRALPVALAAELVAAEMDVIRFAGFRRELTAEGLVTEAVIGYDTAALPSEVRRIFGGATSPRSLPERTPPGVVALAAFEIEARAVMAWLRHVSASNSRGSLRNLDFWLGELKRSTGVDVEADLVDRLGERGWLAVLHGAEGDEPSFVLIAEASDAERIERDLLEVRSWLIDQISGRTLGLGLLRESDVASDDRIVHGLSAWTPFGRLNGPSFAIANGHLVVGSDRAALDAGTRLLEGIESWSVPSTEPQPFESLVVDGAALAESVEPFVATRLLEDAPEAASAVLELLTELDEVALDAWFEADAVRMRGRVAFRQVR